MPCAIQYKINICCYFSKLKSDVKLFLQADSGTKKDLSSSRGGCILCWEKILERTEPCADGAGGVCVGGEVLGHSRGALWNFSPERHWLQALRMDALACWKPHPTADDCMELPLSPHLSQHTTKNKEVFGYPPLPTYPTFALGANGHAAGSARG